MTTELFPLHELKEKFGDSSLQVQETKDEVLTLWVPKSKIVDIVQFLKEEVTDPYPLLYDITAIDERTRSNRRGQPDSDFTVVYHLLSFARNNDIRLKVALKGEYPSLPSITEVWPNANWYEREVYDMFGVSFEGHPHLRRILMPHDWEGHPLRKEHPARATEMGHYELSPEEEMEQQQNLKFDPERWGMRREGKDTEFMFLNLGPQHPGTHGVLRLVLQLDGEDIVDMMPDIGFHHRGAEKMAERQSWHTFIPYTDRIDYLGGVLNNLPYVKAVEKLGGIEVPRRAKYIRVMMSELYRISSHLVWYGTFAQDIGQLSPVFYMFADREKLFEITEAICGGRMHPNWFRIGGVAQDLPKGWQDMMKNFTSRLYERLDEYDRFIMKNKIFKDRTIGVGVYTIDEAVEWGVTGPGLRAAGLNWDFRKRRPYSVYEELDFDIPTGENGDSYDRARVRIEEMRQSLRIIEQCVENMPDGHHKSDHKLTTPPRKDRALKDIETLITHFLNSTWGPVIPEGEAFMGVEAAKGHNGYYLVSDNDVSSYRTRIRAPSFPHMQMVPYISQGYTVADLLTILGSVDYVLADIDR